MGFLGALADFGIKAANFGAQLFTSNKNYELSKDQFEWQKEQANLTREREDTAIQRRMVDMQKAGLNPLLAAGSPAASSTPISNPTPVRKEMPEFRYSVLEQVQAAQALRLGKANISRVEAENAVLANQAVKIAADARRATAEADLATLDRDIWFTKYGEEPKAKDTLRWQRWYSNVNESANRAALMINQAAESFARSQGIEASTAKTQLETAIRERDFNMLKDFGVLDSRGGIAQQWIDLAQIQGEKVADIDSFLGMLQRLFATGAAFKNVFK